MRVLVTGASGLLGAHLTAAYTQEHEVVGVDLIPWWGDRPATVLIGDLTDDVFLAEAVDRARPDILLHCAAMVNVDACEENRALAYALNADLTRRLAVAAPSSCLVVYVTTDGVFKGDVPFVTEQELPCPRTAYGRAKLQGEWEVRLATDNHLIVRTNFYGWSSGRVQTSAEWLYRALEQRKPITLFDDFYFTPLYVVDFVECLRSLIESGSKGLFHLTGKDRVSKHDFGRQMADVAGFSMEAVTRGSIDDAQLKAPRPRDMSLSTDRFQKATNSTIPSSRIGLERFVGDLERSLSARLVGRRDPPPKPGTS